jgi:hypothetical protein
MDLWQAMDYITEYANAETKAQKAQENGTSLKRKATQDDFDNF